MKRVAGFVALIALSVSSVLDVEAVLIKDDGEKLQHSSQEEESPGERNYTDKEIQQILENSSQDDITRLLQLADKSGRLEQDNDSEENVSNEDQPAQKKKKKKRKKNKKAKKIRENQSVEEESNSTESEDQPVQKKRKKKRKKAKKTRGNQLIEESSNNVENEERPAQKKRKKKRKKAKKTQGNQLIEESSNSEESENQPKKKKSKLKSLFSKNKKGKNRNETAVMVPDLINKKEVMLLNEPLVDGSKLKKSSVIVDKDIRLASKDEAKKIEKEVTKLNPVSASLNKDVKLASNVETINIEKKITPLNLSPLDKEKVLEQVDSTENAKLMVNLDNSGISIKETLKQVNDDRKNYNLIKIPSKDLKDNIQVDKFRAELDYYRKIFSSNFKKA